MGVSSSQPIPSSQDNRPSSNTAKPAATPNLAKRAPRYTPTMDDEAASQQLMSEARATHTTDYEGPAIPLNLDGASQDTIANTSGSSKKKAKKARRKQLADSQTSPRNTFRGSPLPTYSLKDLQAFVGPSPSKSQAFPSTMPSTQIEVPDTQTELQANDAPSPTPLTSSQAIPVHVSKKKSKKDKRNMLAEADLNNGNTIPATPYEEAIDGTMPTPSEATEGQASRKRRRKHKSRTSMNSLDFNPTGVAETPVATQEVTSGGPAEGSDEHSGVPDVEEQPLVPRALLNNLKAERLQRSQSARKAPEPANTRQDALEAVPANGDAEAELAEATDTATAVRTPGTTQSASKKKRIKKDKQITETPILDWEAPVRNLDETPAQPFSFEYSDGTEPTKSSRKSSRKSNRRKRSPKDTKLVRYSIGGVARAARLSRVDPNKTYQRARDDDDDERTAADKALEKTHELGQPPDKRTSGRFTADEEELLRRAIRDYQERNYLDTADLVEIIHWSHARKNEMGENTTDQTEEQFKKDVSAFWDEIKSAGLLRTFRDVKKHVRAQYHTCQRGHWSQDEEEQLRELANLHPGNWKLIGTQLNRLELDVYNRWKDYVRHGENRATKRWSTDEEESFVDVLSTVCQRIEDYRAETGQPPLDDYTPFINWHEVCREMGDTRSRLQCQTKWKSMRARFPPATVDVEIKPRKTRKTPPPGQVVAEAEESQKKRRKSSAKKVRESAYPIGELNPPGPEDMLWGDKFDLVALLIEQAAANDCESDDQIVWQDIAEKMNHTWSVRTLQTAYKQLHEVVLEDDADENLKMALTSLYGFIKKNHINEVEDRYQPAQDGEANGEVAPHANSSKKRKRQSGAGSGKASAKKRNKATPNAPKTFKSKELITDSDNEESEPEL
ncbi:hypothetical protein BU25DRAFT_445614 [Macroventuria anomochaeta]|uniref:Uncharacterized protein n=1 Tax=Macroventuria anomochaeta TaxID=301207 RepID=A0ACB6SBY4_9PLEO|nr:uncharacterized protein BU25DRAFT_445614 [Macroventuria anomochaeta]KAF2631483.1 hypothetical protein BU25DRAFT_445614 [Macroventuria anomochaeta]